MQFPIPLALAVRDRADFALWLGDKSFSMLSPLCAIGLVVVSLMLFVVDPVLYTLGVWGADPHHAPLVAWHVCAWVSFLAFLVVARRAKAPAIRARTLRAFFVVSAALFSWFAYLSWMLSGDLSTYAIFLLTMVCVFSNLDQLRKVLIATSTLALVVAIFHLDQRDTFHTSGAAINLAALALVATLLDMFVLRLNLALYREQRSAETERARADHVLYNALPAAIANQLKRDNVAQAQQFADTAVVFLDIAGFTRFSACRRPDEVVRVLNDLFSTFDRLAQRHGVEKIKTIGDAYMAVANSNLSGAVRLAMECVAAVDAYTRLRELDLGLRCGVHVGPTISGVIGLRRFTYDVWGDAVNTASRMESTGLPGRIHVSEDVAVRLQGEFTFEKRPVLDIRGKGRMQTYFVTGCRSAGEPSAAPDTSPSGARTWAGGSSETPSGQPICAGYAG